MKTKNTYESPTIVSCKLEINVIIDDDVTGIKMD